jgi:hypothetical protein
LLKQQIPVGSPQGLRVIRIKVLRWWHITSGFITLHLRQDPASVVLRMAKVHQLALIRRFKDRVPHMFAVGEQA